MAPQLEHQENEEGSSEPVELVKELDQGRYLNKDGVPAPTNLSLRSRQDAAIVLSNHLLLPLEVLVADA